MSSKLRPLTASEVQFELSINPEDSAPDFQCGDPEYKELDDAEEARARARLDRGDYWAWCYVTVTARWGSFSATASLGGCSYADEAEFDRCGYKGELESEALARLNEVLESIYNRISTLAA
jgi:hypothetical protein